MARHPRLALPGYPHHVIQRGNNRQPIVLDEADRKMLYSLWLEESQRHKVAVNAYVLLDNHFHMLLTPPSDEAMSLMMQAVGRTYVRYFNQRHKRSGTLWEGRYKSTLIQTERYLLACMVYIDLNPVRAGLVAAPEQAAWSSVHGNLGLRRDPLLTPHPTLLMLGGTPAQRRVGYRAFLRDHRRACADAPAIREHGKKQCPLGSARFLDMLTETLGRPVAARPRGRPRKPGSES